MKNLDKDDLKKYNNKNQRHQSYRKFKNQNDKLSQDMNDDNLSSNKKENTIEDYSLSSDSDDSNLSTNSDQENGRKDYYLSSDSDDDKLSSSSDKENGQIVMNPRYKNEFCPKDFFLFRRKFKKLIKKFIKMENKYSSVFELLKINNEQLTNLEELQLQSVDQGDISMTILNPFLINNKDLRIIQDYLIFFDFISKQELPNLCCQKYQSLLQLLKENNAKIQVKWTIINFRDHKYRYDYTNDQLNNKSVKVSSDCGQQETNITFRSFKEISQTFSLNLIETENIHILLNPFNQFTKINIQINFNANISVVRVYETFWRQNYIHYWSNFDHYRSKNFLFQDFTCEDIQFDKIKYFGLNNEQIFQISIPSISSSYNHLFLCSLFDIEKISLSDHLFQDITLLVMIIIYKQKIQNILNFKPQNLLLDLLIN